MTQTALEPEQDWIDGFLLVGNQPALDLLNTRILDEEVVEEKLTDTAALIRWLRAAGLATALLRRELHAWAGQPESKSFLRNLLLFRELLREAVVALEAGEHPGKDFLADLNARLSAHPLRLAVTTGGTGFHTVQVGGSSVGDTLWAALLHQTVKLFTEADPQRVRKCEHCIIHFHDTSKKNARRWCSMRLCGNRFKVAAYQERQRLTAK